MRTEKQTPLNLTMVRLVVLTVLALTLAFPAAPVTRSALSVEGSESRARSTRSGEPGTWTKHSGNPVLGPSEPWEGSIWSTFVTKDDSTYRMWYTTNWPAVIGYATSPDGLDWDKYADSPVLSPGASGEWDEAAVGEPCVMKGAGVYNMWYWGVRADGAMQTGYATSPDGIDWDKYTGNPVLSVGSPGSWDEFEAGTPCVVHQNGTYKMWYTGQDNAGNYGIGYATSPDGIRWTRYGSNPVLTVTVGSWDENGVLAPKVLFDGAIYRMWYFGKDSGWVDRVGYATSPDGIRWTKYSDNPVLDLGPSGAWDDYKVTFPYVILDDDIYKMWYIGLNGSTGGRVGYATAPQMRVVYVPIVLKAPSR